MNVDDEVIREVTIPPSRANVWSFILFVVTAVVTAYPFYILYGAQSLTDGINGFLGDYLFLASALILGTIAHELLHAIAFAAGAKNGFRSVRFGFNLKNLAPYVHCAEAVSYMNFLVATLLPGIVLGFVPIGIAMFTGRGLLLVFGAFFTAGAAGDFLCAIRLLQFPIKYRVKDHPDSIGFLIIK